MRTLAYIFLLTFGLNTQAQITLEHTYDSASVFNTCSGQMRQLLMVNFDASGERYVKIDRCGKVIKIYDLNHSLVKTISLAAVPVSPSYSTIGDIIYISDQLFNTDPKIEFMYVTDFTDSTNNVNYITNIYNEDGQLLFSEEAYPGVHPNYHQQQYPIYNTSQGAKMILSYSNGQAKVFSLPGTLSLSIEETNSDLLRARGGTLSNLYPNPSDGAVTLQYELPKGEERGEIILYGETGAVVERYTVDNTFGDIILDNTQLPAGTYFYQLVTPKGSASVKKMVVVK